MIAPIAAPINAREAHHLEFFIILALFLLLLYFPPSLLRSITPGVHSFIEAHLGDSVGLYILHLGIGLVILGGVWPNLGRVGEVGYALITAAMGVLKLTKTSNGSNSSSEQTTGVPPVKK